MVYHPGVDEGKAWKFARPFYRPSEILALTPTNAEVSLSDPSIFVSLDRVRPRYSEMSNNVNGIDGPTLLLIQKVLSYLLQLVDLAQSVLDQLSALAPIHHPNESCLPGTMYVHLL